MKSREGNEALDGELGSHGRGSHHYMALVATMPVVASGGHGLASLLCGILVYLCGPWVLPWINCLGPIGLLFANSHDLVWHQIIYFLLTLGLIRVNLQ